MRNASASAHNRQPRRFALLACAEAKARLTHAMAARLRQDRLHDGDLPETIASDAQRSVRRIVESPIINED